MTVTDLQNLVNYLDECVKTEPKEYYDEQTGRCELKSVVNFNDLMVLISKYPVNDIPEMMPKIAYECDRLACKNCSYPECRHTTNVVHAVNFKALGCDGNVESRYFEKSASMTDKTREYPYVDEHEFNCEYILTNTGEEKPVDLLRKAES